MAPDSSRTHPISQRHVQGIGLELPAQSLGYAHIGFALGLSALALWQPPTKLRLAILGLAYLATLGLPILWIGPLWTEAPQTPRFVWGFYLTFVLSLAIPFALGTVAVTILARRASTPTRTARVLWPILAYSSGLVASAPLTFNYALAYPLIR